MGAVGSDVLEVTYNHPTIGSGSLQCKAGEASQIDQGGSRSTDDANFVTGDGSKIEQKTMARSVFELPPVAWDKVDKNELDILSQLAEASVGADWTVSFLDGTIYQMTNGHPVGDIKGDGYAGTIPLILHGDARAKRIS